MFVGTKVTVRVGEAWVKGSVVEDRGVGSSGHRVLRIGLKVDPSLVPPAEEESGQAAERRIQLELESIRHRDCEYTPRGKTTQVGADRRWLLGEVYRLAGRIREMQMDEHLQLYAHAQELLGQAGALQAKGDQEGGRTLIRSAAALTDAASDVVVPAKLRTQGVLCRNAVALWLEAGDRDRAEASFRRHRGRMPANTRAEIKEMLEGER